jgi:hypothetical protein
VLQQEKSGVLGEHLQCFIELNWKPSSHMQTIELHEYNWNATFNRKFEANLKASPSLFTHMKSTQSVNHDTNTRVLTPRGSRFGFKKKIGSLPEGRVPVTVYAYN